MKTKLQDLTVSEFIELVCGNTDVLKEGIEMVTLAKLSIIQRNILFEYKEIADKSGVSDYLTRLEDLIKARMTVLSYAMCADLLILGAEPQVKQMLAEHGINAGTMDAERLDAVITCQLENAKKDALQLEEEMIENNSGIVDIRKAFDEQTAALMAYFKFQVDPDTMKASIYAHLVSRHNREIKAHRAAMKKQ